LGKTVFLSFQGSGKELPAKAYHLECLALSLEFLWPLFSPYFDLS
jgi:hypothetical protein